MIEALVGIVGVLIGAGLGEFFRRRNRIEVYSEKVFERRLSVYEELFKLVQSTFTVANEVIESADASKEERLAVLSPAVINLTEFTDENGLYLNDHITLHCVALFVGIEDIADITNDAERTTQIENFYKQYIEAKSLIVSDSGIGEVNKHFQAIAKSNPDSEIIRFVKKLERKYGA